MKCIHCDKAVAPARAALQRREDRPILCLPCGEIAARQERKGWCIAPMHKSNYMRITNRSDLQGLNNKGGLVK